MHSGIVSPRDIRNHYYFVWCETRTKTTQPNKVQTCWIKAGIVDLNTHLICNEWSNRFATEKQMFCLLAETKQGYWLGTAKLLLNLIYLVTFHHSTTNRRKWNTTTNQFLPHIIMVTETYDISKRQKCCYASVFIALVNIHPWNQLCDRKLQKWSPSWLVTRTTTNSRSDRKHF
jgi:hypothetical protein